MRVLDPAFLWGLLAIGVPIVLHLLLRRRLPIVEFPLARLVARAEHVQQPRKRLNRVLLLLARALLLALLALSLARLTFGGSEVQAAGPVAVVVVLDDSLSMRAASRAGRSAFEEGRDMADSVLAALPEGSEAAVLPLSQASAAGALRLGSPDAARRELARAAPTHLALQAQAGLDAALRVLTPSPLPDRRVVVVSDLARHGFSDLSLPRVGSAVQPRLVLLVPERADGANLSVSGLDAVVLPGGTLRATARVSAWGEQGQAHRAELEVRTRSLGDAERLAGRGRMDVATGAVAERRFEIAAPPPGLGSTEARLPEDVLPADDVRHAVHLVRRDPTLLVIDGDPQNLSFGSETFYLEKALAPGVGLDLQARLTTVSEWGAKDLEGAAAILVANAPDMSAERAAALEAAVRAGSGLVVTLGNRVDQRAWNGSLAGLLPATLGLVSAPDVAATVAPGGALELPRVHVSRWYRLEPSPDAEVLARLSDGSPLVVSAALGAGRVILLATSIDREWTDLPISPWFLAFVRDLVGRAMPRGDSLPLPPVVVGQEADVSQLSLSSAAVVEGPGAPARIESATVKPSVPGVHVIRDGGTVRAAFAAVTDPAESDLSRVAAEEIARRVQGSFDVGGIVEGGGLGWAGGLQAWKALLLALVALLAAESWLSRRAA